MDLNEIGYGSEKDKRGKVAKANQTDNATPSATGIVYGKNVAVLEDTMKKVAYVYYTKYDNATGKKAVELQR